jgi:prevent-host-death family protein
MKTASVSKLKSSLSMYLRQVKAGEEVLVTERGQAIARLAPAIIPADAPARLREMEKQGLVKLGSETLPRDFWDRPRPKDPKGSMVKTLLQDREER